MDAQRHAEFNWSTLDGDTPHAYPLIGDQPGPLRDVHRTKVFDALFATPLLKRFGRYIVLDVLGKGGMGVVLKGYDDELDRQVAIKVLHGCVDERDTNRLRREAQAMAKLSHPNVVQVFEIGEANDQLFVAMELLRGKTLRQWHKERDAPRPWTECVEVYLEAGRGLAAAHAKGLVHRDFKPSNTIIDTEGRVRVFDFGLACRGRNEGSDEDELFGTMDSVPSVIRRSRTDQEAVVPLDLSLTRTGAVLGTPAYMSPEQMAGREADARSDQFSFCVSLYEAIYGERPFEGETLCALTYATIKGHVRPTPSGSQVPAKIRDLLLRGLSVDPSKRWPSMSALLDELRCLVNSDDDAELTHLRRHLDPRIGVRARVAISLFVGMIHIITGLSFYCFQTRAAWTPGYRELLLLCGVSSACVIGVIVCDIYRRWYCAGRRPMSLMSRSQMSLTITSAIAVVAIGLFGLALGLPLEATAALILLIFGLCVGAMSAFLRGMLAPACLLVAVAIVASIDPEQLWLWWALSGGGGLLLMGRAWHGLRRQPATAA